MTIDPYMLATVLGVQLGLWLSLRRWGKRRDD